MMKKIITKTLLIALSFTLIARGEDALHKSAIHNVVKTASYIGVLKVDDGKISVIENIKNTKNAEEIKAFVDFFNANHACLIFLFEDEMICTSYNKDGSTYSSVLTARIFEKDGKQYIRDKRFGEQPIPLQKIINLIRSASVEVSHLH